MTRQRCHLHTTLPIAATPEGLTTHNTTTEPASNTALASLLNSHALANLPYPNGLSRRSTKSQGTFYGMAVMMQEAIIA
jgi:hypothetical protein